MSLSGSAKLAGIAGWPVGHSMSPLIHGHWIEEYGLDAAYVPLPVQPADFSAVMNGLKAAGFRGVNVTVPHKQAAFALADEAESPAKNAGAANLLVFGEKIVADNTDQPGLIAALNEALGPEALKDRCAVVWGAGGMARAAICALAEMGMTEIRILARDTTRGNKLAGDLAWRVAAALRVAGFDGWTETAADAALLVNATSAGMKGLPPVELPLDVLPKDAAVFDAVYNPLETDLLRQARALGLAAIDGLGLLMHQAAPSFEAFFGLRPAVTAALRARLEKALDG
jgi:shikimate dehydrogenase